MISEPPLKPGLTQERPTWFAFVIEGTFKNSVGASGFVIRFAPLPFYE